MAQTALESALERTSFWGLFPEERRGFLRPLPPWSALSEEALQAVARAMEPMRYPAGTTIIRQGEPGSHLHVLASGRAEARVHAPGGTVVTVAPICEGDCFGEMSLLSGDPTSADVIAVQDTQSFMLDREVFNTLVTDHPGLLREFVNMISRHLSATDVAVGAAREKEQELTRFLQEEKPDPSGELIGKHPAMKEVLRQIDRLTDNDRPVLIQGEHGTGKEAAVRLIHFRSARKDAPLLRTNSGQISATPWGDKVFGDYRVAETEHARPSSVCYMELAAGGTLLLKNIEGLPRLAQERLAQFLTGTPSFPGDARHDVRVIVTCRGNLATLAAAGRVAPALVEALSHDVITLPPLRERKKDIPELATYLARKHAQRLNQGPRSLSDAALIRLVSYDYRFANVRELEEAIERAVILTDDTTIHAEEIIFGPPPDVRPLGFNLLRLPAPTVRRALRAFPSVVQGLTAIIFAFILYQCFFARARAGENWGTLLVWSVWWPALLLMFLLSGRVWCAICPMALAGVAAQRKINRNWRIPAWMKEREAQIVMAGFFAIVWSEEVAGMRHDARATGILLMVILAGAVVTSILFPRRTWCRHLCPLGGFGGLCATTALVELRPTSDICLAKCRDHSCYKGRDEISGCPMFNHVMFVDTNQHCVLCLECVRSCPNGSPQINIRPPARELWTSAGARPEQGRFVALLLGLLAAVMLIQHWERQPYGWMAGLLSGHRFLFVSALLAVGVAVPLCGVWLATRRLEHSENPAAAERFWRRSGAWIPLLTGSYIGYQLAYVPGLDRLQSVLYYQPPGGVADYALTFSLLAALRFGFLTGGLATTLIVLWKLWQTREREEGQKWMREHALSLVGVTAYCSMMLVLMLRPEWLAL